MKKEDLDFLRKVAKEVESWPEWKKQQFGFWGTAEIYETPKAKEAEKNKSKQKKVLEISVKITDKSVIKALERVSEMTGRSIEDLVSHAVWRFVLPFTRDYKVAGGKR